MEQSLPHAREAYRHLKVSISPFFDTLGRAKRLNMRMSLKAPNVQLVNSCLLTFPLQVGNVPTQAYDDGALTASDDLGSIPLKIYDYSMDAQPGMTACKQQCSSPMIGKNESGETYRHWHVLRPTHGDVEIQFVAVPRLVDMKTPVGPRVDLREDQGGLMGAGITFIPIPASNCRYSENGCGATLNTIKDQEYRIIVQWDLTNSPTGTRAVWTFGEGLSVVKVGPATLLRDSVYAVGPIRSYQHVSSYQQSFCLSSDFNKEAENCGYAAQKEQSEDYFGFYWFGSVPRRISGLVPQTKQMFEKISYMFKDPPTQDNPYRIFIRRASPARGLGGSAFQRSYVLEYDTYIHSVSQEELLFLLLHEMIHNWLLMDDETNSPDGDNNGWYIEGIANYFATILPYRWGIHSRAQFLEAMNRNMSSYYTNPLIHIDNRQAQEMAWKNYDALRLIYDRGFAYLVQVNAHILRASGGRRSIDQIVLELLQLKRSGSACGQNEWIRLLSNEIDHSDVKSDFISMKSGRRIIPPRDSLEFETGNKVQFIQRYQELLDFGIDTASFDERIVMDVAQGSRAAKADVKNGDEMVEETPRWYCGQDFTRRMHMILRRDGRIIERTYWPRSFIKAESWQWIAQEKDTCSPTQVSFALLPSRNLTSRVMGMICISILLVCYFEVFKYPLRS
ncbi:hypothetical protein F5884DRAFT_835593 [Xylogone sp. PMI_703]|nr:hypothetical protein F5884DRAFT_835593 [Xylogone sp. PMI_703]